MSNGTVLTSDRNDSGKGPASLASPTRRSTLKLFFCVAASAASKALGRDSEGHGGRVLLVNPYRDVDWDRVGQHKANLHTHTTQSDGRMVPSRVIDEYHVRGYHALAITDHNRSTWPWTAFERDPVSMKMLAISANELSRHHHVLSLFSSYETPESDLDAAVAGVAKAGGLAIVCHPAMHWVPEHSPASGMRAPMAPPLRAITRNDFTVETWFRTSDAGRNVLLGNYSERREGSVNLELHTENRVRVFVQPGAGKTIDVNVSGDALGINTRDGQWHHAAGVCQGGTIHLYLDGRLLGQASDPVGGFELQGDAFFIGRDTRTGSTVFKGDLCRVRLWRRVLSQDEVVSLVSGGLVSGEGLVAQYACPVKADRSIQAASAETSGNPQGPFHAETASGAALQILSDAPEALVSSGTAGGCVRFGPPDFPSKVPDKAVESYINLFTRHRHLVGIEVLNRTRPDREIPLDRQLWDRLLTALMPQRPVWGVAVDDMHAMSHMGGDWVVLLAQGLEERTARESLTTGRYYFASTRLRDPAVAGVEGTPRIERITHDEKAGRLTIVATVGGRAVRDDCCVWISQGRTVHTGLSLAYRRVADLGVYARAEITGDGGTAFTNPFGFLHPTA